jgi:excisionase family DNA binding protein
MREALTTTEAARELGVSAGRIRQFIRDGRLPTERVGRQHLIWSADLEAIRIRPNGRPVGGGRNGSAR